MKTKRNANVVSLTKGEKSAIVSALDNQIRLLEDEPVNPNPVVNKLVLQQIETLSRVITKVSEADSSSSSRIGS